MKFDRIVDIYVGPAAGILAALLGWFIPEFYDWTGADQSRPAPVVPWIALVMLISVIALNIGLLWLHFSNRWRDEDMKPLRFRTQHLFYLMIVVAVLLTLGFRGLGNWVATVVLTLVAIASVVIAIRNTRSRWIILGVWLVHYLPFVWVLRVMHQWNSNSDGFDLLLSLPAFFPTLAFSAVAGQHPEKLIWFGACSTCLQLSLGLYLALRGRKRTVAYLSFVGLSSVWGSFILNALMRM